jgi:hypothetical protein
MRALLIAILVFSSTATLADSCVKVVAVEPLVVELGTVVKGLCVTENKEG